MSRLLFAAARGSRIQILSAPNAWEEDRCVMVWDLQDPEWEYRIHPDDEHLQYGPISTALRLHAETKYAVISPLDYPLIKVDFWFKDFHDGLNATTSERSIFMLILAEALADEGL